LRSDPDELDRLLARGSQRAATLAEPTLAEAYRAVGLSR
jgi:tryptophanyl-tRNA synthetase